MLRTAAAVTAAPPCPARGLAQAALATLALGCGAAACSGDLGPPRARALPAPDPGPALRGGGPPRTPRLASYAIEATLDPIRHQVTASQTLRWTNGGDSPVDAIPLHLYLNAFKNESSLFMQSSRGRMRGAKATDTGWGWIQIESAQVGGVELAGTLRFPGLPDETVAELLLPAPVPGGGQLEVKLRFTAQLPEVFARTGYRDDFHMVAQWFPKVGVRVGAPGAERWVCDPLHHNSEFFADFGAYDVALTVPSTYAVAATGVLVSATDVAGGARRYQYRAEDVHDFAWMADPYMETISGHAKLPDGTVEVRVLARPDQASFARRHLRAGIGAIERMSAAYVPYPWPIMTIISPPPEAAAGAGGMEYPTLVTTAGDSVLMPPGVRIPELVTVHEVGHNWFQGILASNEAQEAWLDEGVTEWATARVMTELYGPRGSAIDWLGWQAEIFALRRVMSSDTRTIPSPIATAAAAFVSNRAYGEQTYGTTMRALRTLEQTVGPSRFAAAMKVYAQTWAFKHPTGKDLFETLSRELGEDLTWYFGPVFHTVGAVALAVEAATCRRAHAPRGVIQAGAARRTVTAAEAPETGSYVCEVVVTNTGGWHVPVDVELRFADGSAQRLRWEDRGDSGAWERFVVERSSQLTEVLLDPDGKLALDSPVRHHVRIAGDGSAALRAGSWIASLAQTLMQIGGL